MLDCARGIALLLMLVSHAMELFPGNIQHDDWLYVNAILLLTKAATPLFVFVFGMTMAFVYYRRVLTQDGFATVKRRMWRRALLVFLSFEFLVVVVETASKTQPTAIVERMLYVRPGNWIEVLNFYIVVLLIGPWVLRWWRTTPIGIRLLIIPVLYGLGVLFSQIPVPSYLFVLKNIIAGYEFSDQRTLLDTFPLLQLSSFFFAGLSLGESLFNEGHTIQWRRVWWLTPLFVLVGVLASYLVSGDAIRTYIGNIALDHYRFPPRLPYILFGLSSVFGVTLLCLWFVQIRNSTWFVIRTLELLGRHSLFTFNLQYVLLFTVYGLFLGLLHQQSVPVAVFNTGIVVGACIVVVWGWERWWRARARG
jgi:uncharacterized membrane protein